MSLHSENRSRWHIENPRWKSCELIKWESLSSTLLPVIFLISPWGDTCLYHNHCRPIIIKTGNNDLILTRTLDHYRFNWSDDGFCLNSNFLMTNIYYILNTAYQLYRHTITVTQIFMKKWKWRWLDRALTDLDRSRPINIGDFIIIDSDSAQLWDNSNRGHFFQKLFRPIKTPSLVTVM